LASSFKSHAANPTPALKTLQPRDVDIIAQVNVAAVMLVVMPMAMVIVLLLITGIYVDYSFDFMPDVTARILFH
jgi:hypothetical protein